MPVSFDFFKQEIQQYLKSNLPLSTKILDVGPGVGTYSKLLKPFGYKLDCVEIFEPYIEKYNLISQYNKVFVENILNFDISPYDFIILGDVLEHLQIKEAQNLINQIISQNKNCLVAVPYQMEQGVHEDNLYEIHHQPDLTPEIMGKRYPNLKLLYKNQYYGYYISKNFESNLQKAYILHANEKYFDIVCTCIKSIRQYSNLPIYLYLLNSNKKCNITNVTTINWNLNLENTENRYINENNNFYINRGSSEIYNILIQKILITIHALKNFADVVAYIDSDSISTPYADNIFNYYNQDSLYPYFGEGIYDWLHHNGRGGAMDRNDLSTTLEHPICELFKINQYNRLDQRYRQTGYFLAGRNNIEFLEEWYWMCIHPTILKNTAYYAPFHEETLLNPLLWSKEFYNGLPLVYTNGTLETINEIYQELGFNGYGREIRPWFKIPPNKEDLMFLHGEKRIDIMNKMIIQIKQLYETGII